MSTLSVFSATARRLATAAALVAFVTGCASVKTPSNVAETIADQPSLSTLNQLLVSTGLNEALKGAGPFTVFAPSNDAFKAVPAKTMDALAKDPAALKAVLTYHVLPVRANAADVKNSNAKTLNGANVALSKAGDFVTVESAAVTQADLNAPNGVVHIVDAVLLPPVKK
jgi:uncharacterized surface protein with fasciclin (FAS1) repeats